MKTLRNVFAVMTLLFVASVQSANAQTLSDFFHYNKDEALKAISFAAHPSNDYKSGIVTV